jgi:ERCC4-type nuclease
MTSTMPRFKYTDAEIKSILSQMIILTDTREKENGNITSYFERNNIQHEEYSLNCGDYSVMIPAMPDNGIIRDIYFDNSIVIERKASLEELSNNLTNERSRFENEFLRAGDAKKFLIIEDASFEHIILHSYNTRYNEKAFLASLLSFQEKYNLNISFSGRASAGQLIYGLLYYHVRNYLLS